MKKRFIKKYCNLLDAVLLIDTLGRMPLTNIIHEYYSVHGWLCNDDVQASRLQDYFESICGFQKRLFNSINEFKIVKTDWYGTYEVMDNKGKAFRFDDKESAMEFKEWITNELNGVIKNE